MRQGHAANESLKHFLSSMEWALVNRLCLLNTYMADEDVESSLVPSPHYKIVTPSARQSRDISFTLTRTQNSKLAKRSASAVSFAPADELQRLRGRRIRQPVNHNQSSASR